jgi:hypothetical protein
MRSEDKVYLGVFFWGESFDCEDVVGYSGNRLRHCFSYSTY